MTRPSGGKRKPRALEASKPSPSGGKRKPRALEASKPSVWQKGGGNPIVGFSFHSSIRAIVKAAQDLLEQALTESRQAPPFDSVERLQDGAFMMWKKSVTYAAGYAWLSRKLGHLVNEHGQSERWKVCEHYC